LSQTLSETLSKSSTHSASESSIQNHNAKFKNLEWKPRRRGPQSKIAQLSSELRALVNQLLDQEKTYEEIVEEMAKHGVSLNTDNVSKWFNGPYQDYLAALDWQDELQQLRDHAFSFGEGEGNVRFQEGLVQIALTQLFRTIKEDRFKDDPANSLRLFNSLARLSHEALVIRKYADQQAKEKTAQLTRLDPNRQISEAEEMAMQDRADDFFGWKSAARLKHDLDSVTTQRDTSVGATLVGSRDSSESAFVNDLGPEKERTGFSPSPPQQEERAGERRPAHDDALLDEQPTASEVPSNDTIPQSKIKIQKSKMNSAPTAKPRSHLDSPTASGATSTAISAARLSNPNPWSAFNLSSTVRPATRCFRHCFSMANVHQQFVAAINHCLHRAWPSNRKQNIASNAATACRLSFPAASAPRPTVPPATPRFPRRLRRKPGSRNTAPPAVYGTRVPLARAKDRQKGVAGAATPSLPSL